MPLPRLDLCLLLTFLTLTGCSVADYQYWQAQHLLREGNPEAAIAKLDALQQTDADNPEYRQAWAKQREAQIKRLLTDANNQRLNQHYDLAAQACQQVLQLEPDNVLAKEYQSLIRRDLRHQAWLAAAQAAQQQGDDEAAEIDLRRILAENPRHIAAKKLQREMEQQRRHEDLANSKLSGRFKHPVELAFNNAPLQAVFDLLSRTAGITFVIDQDVKIDSRVNLFARNSTVEDALKIVLLNQQLEQKILNPQAVLIYPAQPSKQKDHRELLTKSFQLGNADAKQVLNLIKTMVKTRDVFVDEKLNLLVMRDTADAIDVAARLIATQELADPEVTLDVEILEVNSDVLTNLGVQFPDQISVSVSNPSTPGSPAGNMSYPQWREFSSDMVSLTIGDPAVVMFLKNTTGSSNILAQPNIRVRNREKAKIHIGDKLPVISTTSAPQGGSVSESISYLDVGVILEVEPQIFRDNDVAVKLNLEVSRVVKEVQSKNGLLAYQVGSRKASTLLRTHDGSTQVLGGLISQSDMENADRLPGLGNLPLLGRLFSRTQNDHSKSELVLLITPHIIRNLAIPNAASTEFASGTDNNPSTRPLRLSQGAHISNINSLAVDVSERRQTDPLPENYIDPALIEAKLGLAVPAQASVDRAFPVAISIDANSRLQQLSFDLVINNGEVEIVTAVDGGAMRNGSQPAQFRYQSSPGRVHIDVLQPAGSQPHGIVALVQVKPKQANDQVLTLKLENMVARNAMGEAVSAVLPEARQVRVAP